MSKLLFLCRYQLLVVENLRKSICANQQALNVHSLSEDHIAPHLLRAGHPPCLHSGISSQTLRLLRRSPVGQGLPLHLVINPPHSPDYCVTSFTWILLLRVKYWYVLPKNYWYVLLKALSWKQKIPVDSKLRCSGVGRKTIQSKNFQNSFCYLWTSEIAGDTIRYKTLQKYM